MSVESDFYALLSGAAGVTTLVSTRIYPDAMPEDVAYPAVVFSRSTTEIERLLDNSIATVRYELEVNCWAKTRTTADAVADAIAAALVNSQYDLMGQSAGFDAETGLFAAMQVVQRFI